MYVFLKYGPGKLKYAVAASIIIPWVLYIIVGLVIANSAYMTVSYGFCVEGEGIELFKGQVANILLVIVGFIDMCVTSVFGILTFYHVKKNLLTEGNTTNKKSIAKILLFHFIKMFFSPAAVFNCWIIGCSSVT